ncbi:MAG: hypothetical protein VKK42_10080 [Lyngbya sp.]|nr:hypothetical protein [Lyngbya sp.]
MAKFHWEGTDTVTVSQGEKVLCRLTYSQPSLSLPLSFNVPGFGYQQGRILHFQNHFKCNLSLIGGQVEIPSASPFYSLNFNRPWLTVYQKSLNLVVDQPRTLE